MIRKTFLPLALALLVGPLSLFGWDDGPIPLGKLSFKLGTYLTIEGVHTMNGVKTGTHTLVVDTVPEVKLDRFHWHFQHRRSIISR